jgi:hypothetical protein
LTGISGDNQMKWSDKFILEVPYIFLKKIPYAWVAVVALWKWHPLASGIILALVLLGLAMMVWQEYAWRARVRFEFHSGTVPPYMDRPHIARTIQLQNLLLVVAGSTLLGWLMKDRFGLSGWQWGLMVAGVMFLYKNAYLFGAAATYMITDQGLAIRFVPGQIDYRLFFRFHEIRRAERIKVPDLIPRRWELIVPKRYPKEGILLQAIKPEGFSRQIRNEILLAPADPDRFMNELSSHAGGLQEMVSKT